MRGLLFLQTRLIKNGLLSVITNPKRLVFVIFFVAWLGMSLFFALLGHLSQASSPLVDIPVPAAYVRLIVLAFLALLTLTAIERGLEGAVFSFAAPDYDFLFATPIPRRMVVASRVFVDAVTTSFWVAVFLTFTVSFAPARLFIANFSFPTMLLIWVAGCCYAILVINLARIVELLLTGIQAVLGVSVLVLRGVMWSLVAIVVGATIYSLSSGLGRAEVASELLNRPPLSLLLLPLISVASFVTGDTPPLFGSAIATLAMLGLLAATCAVGVCLLDKDVIEATIEHSERMSRMKRAARSQDVERMAGEQMRLTTTVHRSISVGWRSPDLALIYKSIAEISRGGKLRWLGWSLLVIAPGFVAHLIPLEAVARFAPAPVAAYLILLFGSFQSMRFRSELNHMSVLRMLPIPSWRQVVALVLPRTALHSFFIVAGIASFWLGHPVPGASLNLAVAMCIPLAFLNTYLLAAVAACLFPNPADPAQRFFAGLVLTLGTSLALTPTVVLMVFGAVAGLSGFLLGLLGVLGMIPVAILMVLLAALFFDRFEPGEE